MKKIFFFSLLILCLSAAFLLQNCRPKNCGCWDDGIVWRRQWGDGAVGAYSHICLFKIDGSRVVKGPIIWSKDLEIKRTENGDGTSDIIFHGFQRKVVFRVKPNSERGLAPFEMIEKVDPENKFDIAYGWSGTPAALDINSDEVIPSSPPPAK